MTGQTAKSKSLEEESQICPINNDKNNSNIIHTGDQGQGELQMRTAQMPCLENQEEATGVLCRILKTFKIDIVYFHLNSWDHPQARTAKVPETLLSYHKQVTPGTMSK